MNPDNTIAQTDRKMRIISWIIRINLVLWMIELAFPVGKFTANDSTQINIPWFTFAAMLFAAVAQHWVYYKIDKPLRRSNDRKEGA
jgi:hypothetical protein